MVDMPDLASVAALMGDPTRGQILAALMDGRARTATELALEGGVTASTASSHLTRLTEAGLLATARQGRHRYFRLATPDVAATLEGLMSLAQRSGRHTARTGPRDATLRRARVCYDHLAGEVAVHLLDRLREEQLIGGAADALALTARGEAWCGRIGIDLAVLRASRRPLCRSCLDWSERRSHLAGALGAALLERLIGLRYARRVRDSRAVTLSPRGEAFIQRLELAR
jgi:DNA-binding transcriptional ArsR family regulator